MLTQEVKDYWLNHKSISTYFLLPHIRPPSDEDIIKVEAKHIQYQLDQDKYWDEARDYCSSQRGGIFDHWRTIHVEPFKLDYEIAINKYDWFFIRSFDSKSFIYNLEYKRLQWMNCVKGHKDEICILIMTDPIYCKTNSNE